MRINSKKSSTKKIDGESPIHKPLHRRCCVNQPIENIKDCEQC